MTVAASVSLLVLFFILYAFSEELLRLVYSPSIKLFCEMLPSGISLFTLLSSFFSWDLTKNLSDSLLFGLILAVMTGFFFKKRGSYNYLNLLLVMGCIFVIAQTEADNSNEYKTSLIRFDILNKLFSHKYFQILISTGLLILSLRSIKDE